MPQLRHPVPHDTDFSSRLRGPGVASRVGTWLGICFAVAFLTGVYSHLAQAAYPVLPLPARPAWLYRVTQGVHVAAGTAAVPLLLVKLWTVYPKLFARPPRERRALLLHGLERGSIGVLVAGAVFQLATGLANASQWYPWTFSFRATPKGKTDLATIEKARREASLIFQQDPDLHAPEHEALALADDARCRGAACVEVQLADRDAARPASCAG